MARRGRSDVESLGSGKIGEVNNNTGKFYPARKKKVDVSILPLDQNEAYAKSLTQFLSEREAEELNNKKRDDAILSILSRLCHACYDMDAHSEPWVSINRDIEELRK